MRSGPIACLCSVLSCCASTEKASGDPGDGTTALLGKIEERRPAPPPSRIEDAVVWNIRSTMPATKACYETALRANPRTEGKLLVRAAIAPDGRVKRVEVRSAEIADEALKACVQRAVAGWRFPPGEAELEVPINLRSGGDPVAERPVRIMLSRADVHAAMRQSKSAVQACYQRHRVAGTYFVEIAVPADGTAPKVSAKGNPPDGSTAACVCAAVTSFVRFPRYTGAPLVFTYPFILR